jgi:hypothetical protein
MLPAKNSVKRNTRKLGFRIPQANKQLYALTKFKRDYKILGSQMVEVTGVEPVTFAMPLQRSTN